MTPSSGGDTPTPACGAGGDSPVAQAAQSAGYRRPGTGQGWGRSRCLLAEWESGARREAGAGPLSLSLRPAAGAMRSCVRAQGVAGWATPLLLVWQWLPTARPYNLDTQHPLLFQGNNETFFGYSVLLHSHGEERW